MHHPTRAAIAAAFLVICAGADAHAYADISFAGLNTNAQGSGTQFDVFYFGQPLAAGTSFTETFPYTITLHADGDSAVRSWDACVPLPGTDCGPTPTGFEQVEFEFGFLQTKEASPFTSYQFTGLPAQSLIVDSAGTATYSGTFAITETIAPMGFFGDLDYLVVWDATWIDSNDTAPAVPEPGTGWLVLVGLGVLGARRKARQRFTARASPSRNPDPRRSASPRTPGCASA